GIDHRRVEAHGIANLARTHHLANERLARRILEAIVEAEHDREHADLPEQHHVEHHEETEDQRLRRHQRLQHDHQPSLVDTIGDDAAVGPEDQHRQRLEREHETDRRGRVGQGEDQPGLSDRLHPRPDQRCALPEEEAAEIRYGQCRERAPSDRADAAPLVLALPASGCSSSRSASVSRTGTARASASRSAESRSWSSRERASLRSNRMRSSRRRPFALMSTRQTRRSPTATRRRISPAPSSFGMSRESMVGFSPANPARSERRNAPRRSIATRTSTSVVVSEPAAAVGRSLRDRRAIAMRSLAAPASEPSPRGSAGFTVTAVAPTFTLGITLAPDTCLL